MKLSRIWGIDATMWCPVARTVHPYRLGTTVIRRGYPSLVVSLSTQTRAVGTWNFEFHVDKKSLFAQYELPQEIASLDGAMSDFFASMFNHLRTGPTSLLDLSSSSSLQNTARTLAFLQELQVKAEELIKRDQAMEAINLVTTRWHLLAPDGYPLLRLSAKR